MAAQLTTLTPADLQRFERDGYVVVRQAFSRDDGLAMERRWWRELEDAHGIRRDDRSSWRQIVGDLKAAKRDPVQARILTGRVRGVFDDLLGPVAPRGGGTLILSGSPRLLTQQERRMPADQRPGPGALPWDRFHRSHPWLMALTGQAPSPADRIAAFMDGETSVDGVPLRVVELTGAPGDMVFCHPVIVHCVAPNRGGWPRFMRIKQQVLTHEGP